MVQQNEYLTWKHKDPHARAYRTLATAKAKDIALQLGISNPQREEVCLICHSDRIVASLQGKNYAVSDGVGCEGCHGGAKGWIGSHSRGWATRAENVTAGMYPTHEPLARAHLCQSCHQSNVKRPLNHTLLGAGHPRLVFELDTYTLSQPAHFRVDEDYRARKPGTDSFNMWRAGQLNAARIQMTNIIGHIGQDYGTAPDFALFECFVCHQPMSGKHNNKLGTAKTRSVPRLQTSALLMVQALAEAFVPDQARSVADSRMALLQASLGGRTHVLNAAEQVLMTIDQIERATATILPDSASLKSLLRSIAQMGEAGLFVDFTAAEQAVTATAMTIALTDWDNSNRWNKPLNSLYQLIDKESRFAQQSLRDQFKKIRTLAGEN